MLKKLLKYDMKSTMQLLLPFSVTVLATTVAGTVAFRILQMIDSGEGLNWILSVALGLLFIATVFALLAFVVCSQILVLYRYYKNLFTDEGYLTFTLPVKTSSLLNAKLLNAAIWSVYSVLICILCIIIYVGFGSAEEGLFNTAFFEEIGKFFTLLAEEVPVGMLVKYGLELLFFTIVSLFYGIISIYLAIAIGAVVAKKHKLLTAIGVYYIMNTGVSVIVMLINSLFSVSMARHYDYHAGISSLQVLDEVFWINTGFFLLLAVAGYFFTRHLLKNKLNLS